MSHGVRVVASGRYSADDIRRLNIRNGPTSRSYPGGFETDMVSDSHPGMRFNVAYNSPVLNHANSKVIVPAAYDVTVTNRDGASPPTSRNYSAPEIARHFIAVGPDTKKDGGGWETNMVSHLYPSLTFDMRYNGPVFDRNYNVVLKEPFYELRVRAKNPRSI